MDAATTTTFAPMSFPDDSFFSTDFSSPSRQRQAYDTELAASPDAFLHPDVASSPTAHLKRSRSAGPSASSLISSYYDPAVPNDSPVESDAIRTPLDGDHPGWFASAQDSFLNGTGLAFVGVPTSPQKEISIFDPVPEDEPLPTTATVVHTDASSVVNRGHVMRRCSTNVTRPRHHQRQSQSNSLSIAVPMSAYEAGPRSAPLAACQSAPLRTEHGVTSYFSADSNNNADMDDQFAYQPSYSAPTTAMGVQGYEPLRGTMPRQGNYTAFAGVMLGEEDMGLFASSGSPLDGHAELYPHSAPAWQSSFEQGAYAAVMTSEPSASGSSIYRPQTATLSSQTSAPQLVRITDLRSADPERPRSAPASPDLLSSAGTFSHPYSSSGPSSLGRPFQPTHRHTQSDATAVPRSSWHRRGSSMDTHVGAPGMLMSNGYMQAGYVATPAPQLRRTATTIPSSAPPRTTAFASPPSATKPRTPRRRQKSGDNKFSFVNFTSCDAKKLMSGVAPSGSSKRRREEEAAAAARRVGEPSVKEEDADSDEQTSPRKRTKTA